MNDFGLLVGEYLSALPTLSDGEKSELQLDVSGRLILSGRYFEDAAHSSGDAGLAILAVRNDAESSLVGTDGDYAMLQVDANGRLKVAAAVTVEPSDAEYAEDSAHSSGDVGLQVLAVRQDTLASSTSTDGDYASFKVNANGELYTHDTDANASLDNIETSVGNIETSVSNIESDIDSLTKLEDSAHASGDAGIMSLAVRNDAESSLVGTDGDYAPLQVDANGRLKVDSKETLEGAEEYAVTDALTANADGLSSPVGNAYSTVAFFAVGVGEVAHIYGWQWAADVNAEARLVVNDGTDNFVYKVALNSSAMPSYSEHFSKEGRIEIPGGASTEVRLQIKKRGGSDGNGTGSIHARVV